MLAKIASYSVVQQALPFLAYWLVKRQLDARQKSESILDRTEYHDYTQLSAEELDDRLHEEHDRMAKLEDKTFRLSFAITFGLAIFGVGSGLTIGDGLRLDAPTFWILVALVAGAAIYFWCAALLAAGALESVSTYGIGTRRRIMARTRTPHELAVLYAKDLACQELANLNRHNRNNATYMSLRNGLFLLLAIGVVALIEFVRTTC